MTFSLKTIRRAEAEVRRTSPNLDAEDFDEAVQELLQEWEADAADERELHGLPIDTPCIESGRDNCNDHGTGEGQFHGRI